MEEKVEKTNMQLWANNVYVILKKKNVMIGEFQKKLHLGNGYLARIKSGKLIPTADKFIAISYECGFDMNVMIENDFSRYHDSVYVINEALNKLIKQVETDEWYLDPGEDSSFDGRDFINFLYQARIDEQGITHMSYNSAAFPNDICSTERAAYSLWIPGNKTLTLISFDRENQTYYELLTMGSGFVNPICSSVDKVYDEKLKKLYSLIREKFKNGSVKKETLDMLVSFLQLK